MALLRDQRIISPLMCACQGVLKFSSCHVSLSVELRIDVSLSLISMKLLSAICLSQNIPFTYSFHAFQHVLATKQKSQCQTEFKLQYMSSNELEKRSQIHLDSIVPGITNIKSKTNFSKTASDFIEVKKVAPIQNSNLMQLKTQIYCRRQSINASK